MADVVAIEPAVQKWLNTIAEYERDFKRWEGRVEKIIKRYRDEQYQKTSAHAKSFNILWSNVQTLVPATFSKLPKPDVSRRFRDNDPVGRVASLILERAEDYEIRHYPWYRDSLKACVYDRFLGGRGTVWVRYEPNFKAKAGMPEDGLEITEDAETEPENQAEELDYECAPVDYVHWKDFGHEVARTWDEVTSVWRKVYMSRQACIERFGDELGKQIPLDSKPDKDTRKDYSGDMSSKALVYEIWSREGAKAIWLSKSMGKILDERDDPLKLENFFPCPKPLYATITNDSLVPVPDFALYQDQANELDILSDRIDGLVKALQVKGVYNTEFPELARLFTEGENGTMIPVKAWNAFSEKNGLAGAIDLVDIAPIAKALVDAYGAFEQIKSQIYDITGLSDIVRGSSEASETATAQKIKGQFASMRLRHMQEDVARFATEILQIMAQVMCGQFEPQTLVKISAAEQLSPNDQPLIGQALALLVGEERLQNPEAQMVKNPLRDFRVEIAADSLVQIDEAQEKQDRVEFLKAQGEFMDKASRMMQQAGAAGPALIPVIMELWKFGTGAFKAGKTMEGAIDEAADKLKQMAQQPPPPPPPDPALVKVQADAQAQQAQMQMDAQKAQLEAQIEMQKAQSDAAATEREAMVKQGEAELKRLEAESKAQIELSRLEFDRWKAQLEADTKVAVAQLSAQTALKTASMSANAAGDEQEYNEGGESVAKPTLQALVDAINQNMTQLIQSQSSLMDKQSQSHKEMVSVLTRPRKLIRDASGRPEGLA
jgi:hypothetical protein